VPIALESPNQPEVVRLIEELDAYQTQLYPPESNHLVDIDSLSLPNVLFAVVRDESGRAIGCGAVLIGQDYAELKRMFVLPACRGRGIAKSLLTFLESEARARGATLFTLETGVNQHEAIALYEKAGYVRCEPFGDYWPDPLSVFHEEDCHLITQGECQ
jgi:putative acetyltransferase